MSSYRLSRRSGLDLKATYQAMDAAVAAGTEGVEFGTCVIGLSTCLTRTSPG